MIGMYPAQIREAITNRIAAIVVPDLYRQTANDAYSEAIDPLLPEYDPSSTVHLSFFVDDRDIENSENSRSRVDYRELPLVQAPVTIRFLYHVRPMSRKIDWDGSSSAATHVLRELLSEPWDGIDLILRPERRMISRIPLSNDVGEFVSVEVRLIALYPLNLATPT